MKADLKAKWVAALRSGEFKQVRRRLYRQQEFCCLGVALHVLHGYTPTDDLTIRGCFLESTPEAPHTWEETLRLTGVDSDARMTLADMNDRGKSFSEIANWIDANIPADAEAQS